MEAPPGEARQEGGAAPSRRSWILAGAAASVVFLVFESVGAFVAVPLRELSSVLAQFFLGAIGFPVTRHGTILSTPKATFDVVPACSGSTTLQVLLFLSIVWCGVHPRLSPGRRILAVLLAIPLAILANALRVSALVGAGHVMGGPPDDFLHALTGVAAFALAMLCCFLLTQRLASTSKAPEVTDRALSWGLGGLLAFLSLPFFSWCLESWGGRSLDRFGYVFLFAAAGIAVWKWKRATADRSRETAGTVGLGFAFLGLAAATLIDVNLLRGFSLVLAFLSLCVAHKGIRFASSMIPVTLLGYLGFPTVSYQLGILTSWKFATPSFLAMKAVLGLLLLALLAAPYFRRAGPPSHPSPVRLLPIQVLMAALLAAFQTFVFLAGGSVPQQVRLEMSYVQGAWIGADSEPPRSEREYFGSDRIWSKRFRRESESVDVLVTSTGGDRHRAHPPAYCVTGAGWEPLATKTADYRLGDGTIVPTTLLRLRKGGQELAFCYWFTNGSESHASYSGMMLHDTMRRLGGRRADWLVFRVMTTSGEAALEEFLSRFQAKLEPRGPGPGAP